jgi:hypothetical protein
VLGVNQTPIATPGVDLNHSWCLFFKRVFTFDHSSAQPCTKIIICCLQLWCNKRGCSIKEDSPVLYVMLCHNSATVNTGVHTGTGVVSDLEFWASGKHHPQTPGILGVASTPVSTLV